MKILLNTLIINNFKGIKDLTINFDPCNTNIFAANEVGKTTISDAWHWLLTGKNSNDQKDFNIKNTVDTSLNRADHEVTAIITANGTDVTLRKVYREKWQKKRGSELSEYTGNETIYYFNEVPVQQYDYQAKLNGLFDENVLKMITNPLYFNSNTTNWGWRNRRDILLTIAGKISDDEIFATITTDSNRSAVAAMIEKLKIVKTTLDYKKMIGEQKKKLKADLEMIPARIDEASRSKSDELDWSAIATAIEAKKAEIEKIDAAITDANKAVEDQHEAYNKHQQEIHLLAARKIAITNEVSMKIENEKSGARMRLNELSNKVTEAQRAIDNAQNTIKSLKSNRDSLDNEIQQLREKWASVNESEIKFDEGAFHCPACKRAFEEGDIESKKATLTANFNNDKARQLNKINEDGHAKSARIKQIDADLADIEERLQQHILARESAESELKSFDAGSINPSNAQSLDDILAANDDYIQVTSSLAKLNGSAPQIQRPDHSVFTLQKNQVNAELDLLKKQLNSREQNKRADERIEQLKAEEKTLSQELANLERTEFLIDSFDRAKMDILEERVNGKFKDVTFKLFDRQVNGGETPTCETMYKGVPFSDLNTAGRIWAGIRIINTLSDFFGISAPIFLDNRESVSNIPETDAQVINLVVSPEDKQIRIVTGSEQLAVA